MSANKEQCDKKPCDPRRSWKYRKKIYSRLLRRQSKRDPENAWRKHYYWGYSL